MEGVGGGGVSCFRGVSITATLGATITFRLWGALGENLQVFGGVYVLVPSLGPSRGLVRAIRNLGTINFGGFVVISSNDGTTRRSGFPRDSGRGGFVILHRSIGGNGNTTVGATFGFVLGCSAALGNVVAISNSNRRSPRSMGGYTRTLLRRGSGVVLNYHSFSLPRIPPEDHFNGGAASFVFGSLYNVGVSSARANLHNFPVRRLPFLLRIGNREFRCRAGVLLGFGRTNVNVDRIAVGALCRRRGRGSRFGAIESSVHICDFVLNFVLDSATSTIVSLLMFCLMDGLYNNVFNNLAAIITATVTEAISSLAGFAVGQGRIFACRKDTGGTVFHCCTLTVPRVLISTNTISVLTGLFSTGPRVTATVGFTISVLLFFVDCHVRRA